MTQDEIKAIKNLISATKEVIARTEGKFFGLKYDHFCFTNARGAINQAQKVLANDALDRMAENARELGLSYEPESKDMIEIEYELMCKDEDSENTLHWHALNYRTASTAEAPYMFKKLENYVREQINKNVKEDEKAI